MKFSYDNQLAVLVSNDAVSIDGVVQTLQAMDSILDGSRDGLKWFNTLYLQVTLAVKARVAKNDFADPQGATFIANLDCLCQLLLRGATGLVGGWRSTGELGGDVPTTLQFSAGADSVCAGRRKCSHQSGSGGGCR
jgi:Family of unknown function (DUF5995)